MIKKQLPHKRIPFLKGVHTIITFFLLLLFLEDTVNAAEFQEPFKMLTTAYYYGETTATGVPVREGICAVKKEWVGKTAIIYERNENGDVGDCLGIYECLDTGFGGDADGDGIGSIQTGKVIDVYFENLAGCKEWMKLTGGKVYVQLVDAAG